MFTNTLVLGFYLTIKMSVTAWMTDPEGPIEKLREWAVCFSLMEMT